MSKAEASRTFRIRAPVPYEARDCSVNSGSSSLTAESHAETKELFRAGGVYRQKNGGIAVLHANPKTGTCHDGTFHARSLRDGGQGFRFIDSGKEWGKSMLPHNRDLIPGELHQINGEWVAKDDNGGGSSCITQDKQSLDDQMTQHLVRSIEEHRATTTQDKQEESLAETFARVLAEVAADCATNAPMLARDDREPTKRERVWKLRQGYSNAVAIEREERKHDAKPALAALTTVAACSHLLGSGIR
jgi:hypothetical protein